MSIRTGMFPPPNAGNTGGPLSYGQGGLPPAPNPFAPMPPMPLAGMPPPPMMPPMMGGGMPPPPMGSGIGSSSSGIQASNAPRRRIFGDYLENTMSSRQPRSSQVSSVDPRYSQTPQFAPRPDSREARPLMNGGIVQGYDDGGSVQYMNGGGAAKPNMKQFMDATGVDFQTASLALSGSVGSNVDIRDWDKIMDSENILQATQAATSQMYSSGSAIAGDQRFYDSAGNYTPTAAGYDGTDVGASTGGPKLEILNGQVYITSSDGLPLTGLSAANAASFGITQNQIDAAIDAGGTVSGDVSNAGYVPYDSGNLLIDYSGSGYSGSGGVSSGSGGALSGASGASGASYGAVSQPVNVVDSTDYNQFNGDVGNFSNTGENFALYGPSQNIPAFNSQYISAPSGGLTTTNGPNMTAVSGIGALNMPARPVDLDVLDWLSEPTYGSLNSPVEEMMNGGSVPRQTEIAGQPHMLAYINPEEEQMLYAAGGSGNPGPGGIPAFDSYSGDEFGSGNIFTETSTGASTSNYGNNYSHSTDNDDDGPSADEIAEAAKKVSDANKAAAESMLSAGIGGVGGTNYNPTANDDDGPSNAEILAKYTDNETSALDDYSDTLYNDSFDLNNGSVIPGSVVDNLANASASGNTNLSNLSNYGNNDRLDAVVNYNQNAGNQNDGNNNVTTLTESQLNTASSDNQGLTSSELVLAEQQAAAAQAAAEQAASQAFFDQISPPTFTSRFPSSDDDSGSVSNASSPSPLNLESFIPPFKIPPSVPGQMSTNQMYDPIAPVSSGLGATDDDLETDFSIYDTDTDTADTDNALSLGLGGLRPANVGLGRGSGFKSLEQLKAEISEAEGTSDEGGYDRLLDKGETGTFSGNKPLTEMTVAEAVAFGKSDDYRNYSRDVLGRGPDELPSTPMGKYQIVGNTLADLVERGLVDPNAMFDADTQEQIGSLLVNNRGYNDVLSGDITQAEFEKNLGNEFEGIQKDEDFSLSKVTNGQFNFGNNEDTETNVTVDTTGINQVIDDESQAQKIIADNELAAENTDKKPGTDLYLSAVKKNASGEKLSDDEQRALYGARGQTPNAAESSYIQDLLGGAKHAEDGPIGKDGEPIYKAGDSVDPETFMEKAIQVGLGAIDTLYNPLAIFGDEYTIAGNSGKNNDKKVSEQLEAYKNGGTFVYGDDGKTVIGVAAPNYDASGDGNNDTVVLYDENGEFNVTGDGVAASDISLSNANSDSTIDIFESKKTYTNTEDGVVTNSSTDTDTDTSTSTSTSTSTDTDTDYTTDQDGNRICNKEGYVYDPVEDKCVPAVAKEKSTDTSLNIGTGASRSFEDVLKNIQTKPTTIAPISANIKPMAMGGMAGLNRTADNFLRALGG